MLCYCFTASERSGNSGNTALCNGEECINYTLSCYKKCIGCFLFFIRSFTTYRPSLHHRHLKIVTLIVCNNRNGFFDSKFAFFNFFYSSAMLIRNHDTAFNNGCFLNNTDYVTGLYLIADSTLWNKFPFLFSVKRRYFNTSSDVITAYSVKAFKRSLNTVIYCRNKSRSKLNAHRHSG